WGSFGSGAGQFNNPAAVAADGSGNIYVADENNNRVETFGPLPPPPTSTPTPTAAPTHGPATVVKFNITSPMTGSQIFTCQGDTVTVTGNVHEVGTFTTDAHGGIHESDEFN